MREEQAATFTPGEWYAVAPNPNGSWFKEQHFWSVSYRNGNTGGMLGAQIAEVTSLNTGHEEANARLIAAAPSLLAALIEERRIRLLGQEPDVHWESLRELRRASCEATDSAIARATGEV